MYRIKFENRNSRAHTSPCKVCDKNKEEELEERVLYKKLEDKAIKEDWPNQY